MRHQTDRPSSTPGRIRALQTAQRLLLSAAVSVLTLSLLFGLVAGEREISVSLLLDALRQVAPLLAGLYLVSLLVQTFFRAARYRLLLVTGGEPCVPGLGHLYLVTLARNMLVDLFPARVGELGYVAMLNRGYRVSAEGGFSSLSVSILFDFLALGLVVLLFVFPSFLANTPGVSPFGLTALLIATVAAGWWFLFAGFPRLARNERFGRPARKWRWTAKLLAFLVRFSDTLIRTRRSGALTAVLGYSAGVRIAKYAGLYALFVEITRPLWPEIAALPPWSVLATLILAEGAASLPLPALMSFGAYEAGGTAALVLLGFTAADAALAMLAMHVVSQALDYSMGGLAFVAFLFCAKPNPSSAPVTDSPKRPTLRAWAATVALLMVAVGAAGFTARNFRSTGSWNAPDSGEEKAAGPDARRAVRKLLGARRGRIVWSSNRQGNHDLFCMDLPDLRIRPLTRHPHTETYPRFGPRGRFLVFCRSHLPWVSQRDPVPWDLYLLDLETGEERLLTRYGYQPSWSSDGKTILFVRRGTQVVEHRLANGEETVRLERGKDGIQDGIFFQTPHGHATRPEIAVTLRGRRRAAGLLVPGEGIRKIVSTSGCQLFWSPDGTFLYWMDHGGRMGLSTYRARPESGTRDRWIDLPEPYSHQYFPRLSRDGTFMVLAASTGGHEHDTADYEVFLWRVGSPEQDAVRLTFHSGNDGWPDVYLDPEPEEESRASP